MNTRTTSDSIETETLESGVVLAHYILERDDMGAIKRNYTAPGESPYSALSNLLPIVTGGSLPEKEKETAKEEIQNAISNLLDAYALVEKKEDRSMEDRGEDSKTTSASPAPGASDEETEEGAATSEVSNEETEITDSVATATGPETIVSRRRDGSLSSF